MRVDLDLAVDIQRTARTVALEGIFDVPEAKRSTVNFHFDVPLEAQPWQVGLIVGPSGAGKSSVARHLFDAELIEGYDWDNSKSLVDSFPADLPMKEITGALSSVGFSSPPAWLKPFHVLSTGEKFRATMARALVDPRQLIVMDEFTSVVDRQVARVGANSIAKAVRRVPGKQFVAVTCHADVEDWLQPDWVLEPHVGAFRWRSLQRRPSLTLEIVRCVHPAWTWFAKHHYLSAELNKGAKCFVGLVDGDPVAFAGLIPFPHPIAKNVYKISRRVIMPDYQGLGVATAFANALGQIALANGKKLHSATAHPALIASQLRSSIWRVIQPPRFAPAVGKKSTTEMSSATRRRVATFAWNGSPLPAEQVAVAQSLWSA